MPRHSLAGAALAETNTIVRLMVREWMIFMFPKSQAPNARINRAGNIIE
jgi:hypothetical protein